MMSVRKINILVFTILVLNTAVFVQAKPHMVEPEDGLVKIIDDGVLDIDPNKYLIKLINKQFYKTDRILLKDFLPKKEKNNADLILENQLPVSHRHIDKQKIEIYNKTTHDKNLSQSEIIYLDYQGATPCEDMQVKYLFLDALKHAGNMHAKHQRGRFLRKAYDYSKKILADIIFAEPEEIYFTSGATEANNLAILGYVRSLPKESHIITTAIEHPSVLKTIQALSEEGYEVTILKVDKHGSINITEFSKAISPKTKFASIIYANHEIGTIQNIKEIGRICHEKGIVFHTDAAQAFGKLHINVKEFNIDMLTASAAKVYGISGIGLLYINNKVKKSIKPIMYGGSQQDGIRPGTVPIALVLAFAKASQITYSRLDKDTRKIKKIYSQIHHELMEINKKLDQIDNHPVIELNGHPDQRIYGNLNYTIRGVDPNDIMDSMSKYAISLGSACTSHEEHSHVISAIDKNSDKSATNIRIGFGRFTKKSDIDSFLDELGKVIKYLRKNFKDRGSRSCKMNKVNL